LVHWCMCCTHRCIVGSVPCGDVRHVHVLRVHGLLHGGGVPGWVRVLPRVHVDGEVMVYYVCYINHMGLFRVPFDDLDMALEYRLNLMPHTHLIVLSMEYVLTR
jgi:hypothetical protein